MEFHSFRLKYGNKDKGIVEAVGEVLYRYRDDASIPDDVGNSDQEKFEYIFRKIDKKKIFSKKIIKREYSANGNGCAELVKRWKYFKSAEKAKKPSNISEIEPLIVFYYFMCLWKNKRGEFDNRYGLQIIDLLKPEGFFKKERFASKKLKAASISNGQPASKLSATYPANIDLAASYQEGRDEFEQAKDALLPDKAKTDALTTAVYGAGGYGKTSLAQELCNDEKIRTYFSGGIYWLQFGLDDSTDKDADIVRLPEAIEHMLDAQYRSNQRSQLPLENNDKAIVTLLDALPEPPLLLIADDIWTSGQTNWISERLLPDNISILITTRRKSVALTAAKIIKIERLTDEAPFKLLTYGMESLTADQSAKLWKLANKGFKGWPLLLSLANGVFKNLEGDSRANTDRAIGEYEEFFIYDQIDAWGTEELGEEELEKRRKLVGCCIEVGLKAIHSSNRPDLLRQLAVFPDDVDIPFSVIADLWNQDDEETITPIKARVRLKHFKDFSFFSAFSDKAQTLKLHDEILAYFRVSLDSDKLQKLHKKLLASIKQHCPEDWDSLPAKHQYGWTHVLYHLEKAGLKDKANDLRTDFKWLQVKLKAVGVNELQRSFIPLPKRKDARDTGRAINLSVPVLSKRPEALALQLYGRLGHNPTGRIEQLAVDAKDDPACKPQPKFPHLLPLGSELIRLQDHGSWVTSVAFNSKGDRILTASSDDTARIWNAVTGVQLWSFGHDGDVRSTSFNRDGDRVVTASDDGTARIWNAETGAQLWSLGHGSNVTSALFNRYGDRVVTSSLDGLARIWDAETGKKLWSLKGHDAYVISAVFNRIGDRVVTASWDCTARIWDVETGVQLWSLGHDSDVTSVSFNPVGDRLVTASGDGIARIWDTQSGEKLRSFERHRSRITSASFDKLGDRVVTVSWDLTARIWDAKTIKEIRSIQSHDSRITSAAFNQAGDQVVSTFGDGTVRIWSAENSNELPFLSDKDSDIMSAEFNRSGDRVVTAYAYGTGQIWDAETGEKLRSLAHGSLVMSAAFNQTDDRVVTVSGDGTIQSWNAETGKQLDSLGQGSCLVMCAAFDPTVVRLVIAFEDGTAQICDAKTGEKLRTLEELDICGYFTNVSFSPTGDQLVTTSNDGTTRIWNTKSGEILRLIHDCDGYVSSIAFDRTGDRVVTTYPNGTVQIWNAKTGEKLRSFELQDLGAFIKDAAFNQTDDRFVTISPDGIARIWDTKSGEKLLIVDFDANPTFVNWRGNQIVVGLQNGQVCIFYVC